MIFFITLVLYISALSSQAHVLTMVNQTGPFSRNSQRLSSVHQTGRILQSWETFKIKNGFRNALADSVTLLYNAGRLTNAMIDEYANMSRELSILDAQFKVQNRSAMIDASATVDRRGLIIRPEYVDLLEQRIERMDQICNEMWTIIVRMNAFVVNIRSVYNPSIRPVRRNPSSGNL